MAQATKAKFPEAGPFHQALTTQVEPYFTDSGRPARELPAMYAKTVGLPGWFVASYTFLVFVADGVCRLHSPALSRIIEKTCRVHDVRYHAQDDVRAALGSPVRWLKRMGQPLAVEAM